MLFDALVIVTPNDFLRLRRNYYRLIENLPARRVLFVGNEDVGRMATDSGFGDKAGFINEDKILPFASVHEVMRKALKDILKEQELPRGITGWYYQQFLKMQYVDQCQDVYYLVWDGDTIPCSSFSMFYQDGALPYLDLKKEYHKEYFTTIARLFPGMSKCIEKSFVSEHMLFRCDIMKQLIADIENNQTIPGELFWEKIIYSIDAAQIQESSFSEYETYGTYVCTNYPSTYRIRNWHSFRLGGEFFDPNTITEADYQWLSQDFNAISFEKGQFVREDHKGLFDNKKYQEKLSARRMLEIAQQEFKEGYLESWD